jgi:hypothetical protein
MYQECPYIDLHDKYYFINLLEEEILDDHEKGGMISLISERVIMIQTLIGKRRKPSAL